MRVAAQRMRRQTPLVFEMQQIRGDRVGLGHGGFGLGGLLRGGCDALK
jgi:hypothetical protein